MERVTNIELPMICKVTDLIETETLDLILKGLSEEGKALVVEEMDGEGIKRVPVRSTILSSYWSPLCGYVHEFKTGGDRCRISTEDLARDILEGKIEPGRHRCHLGLEVFSIPFTFQGKKIGVMLGGKYRTEENKIEEKLAEFFNSYFSQLQKEGFDFEEAKKCIPKIKEISEDNINAEIERLKEAACQIMRIGEQNYELKKNLVYQEFRSQMMRYFVKETQTDSPIETIHQRILEEVNHLFKIKYSLFILTRRDEDMIISAPHLGLTQEIVRTILTNIKENFKKKDNLYWWNKEEGTKYLAQIRDKFDLDSLPQSVYAIPLLFRDDSSGFLIFIEPEGMEKDDRDFCEFIQILADVFTSHVNLLIGDEEKADFIAEMVHRLKAPMQLLMTKSSTLENRLSGIGGVKDVVQGIKDGVLLLDHQTKSYSFITTKERYSSFKRQPIHSLVKRCTQRFESIATSHNITFQPVDIRGEIEEIEVDKEMMDVAISNLLDNATKYSSQGSYISIRISFDHKKKVCCISIGNKGYRILDEEKERIFERYYRGKALREKGFIPGTGIGLTVVKEIVEDIHKGKIEVENQAIDKMHSLNLFSLYLPYRQEERVL